MILMETAGFCRRPQHGFLGSLTLVRLRSARQVTWPAQCDVRLQPTASMRSASDKTTQTGQTGMPRTWWRRQAGRSCRSNPPGPTGLHAWLDVVVRLSGTPVVSIASIQGRVRGTGSDFILACDLRFASRENTLLGQPQAGMGLVPGGGPMARLSRLVGRGRAISGFTDRSYRSVWRQRFWPENGRRRTNIATPIGCAL